MIVKVLLGSVVFSGSLLIAIVIWNFIGYGMRLVLEREVYFTPPRLKEVGPNCVYGFFGSIIVVMIMFASYGIGISLF